MNYRLLTMLRFVSSTWKPMFDRSRNRRESQ